MTRNNLLYFILFTLMFGQYCYGQTINKDSLLKELRKADRVEGIYIGMGGIHTDTSKIFKTAQLLLDICSIDTLVKLTSDSSPVVRCYAFSGLFSKNADKKIILDIVDKHKNDTTKVFTISSDKGWDGTVNLYMERMATGYGMYNKQTQPSDSINVIKK